MNTYLTLLLVTYTLSIPIKYRNITGNMMSDTSACTAVAISPTALLTASHCVSEKSGPILIEDHPTWKVQVKRNDPESDLALLEVSNARFKYVRLGNLPAITDRVYTVNSGHSYVGTYGEGYIKNIFYYDPYDKYKMIMDSILITEGASGSGLFNSKKELIGINIIKTDYCSLAVNTSTIKKFLYETHPH